MTKKGSPNKNDPMKVMLAAHIVGSAQGRRAHKRPAVLTFVAIAVSKQQNSVTLAINTSCTLSLSCALYLGSLRSNRRTHDPSRSRFRVCFKPRNPEETLALYIIIRIRTPSVLTGWLAVSVYLGKHISANPFSFTCSWQAHEGFPTQLSFTVP